MKEEGTEMIKSRETKPEVNLPRRAWEKVKMPPRTPGVIPEDAGRYLVLRGKYIEVLHRRSAK